VCICHWYHLLQRIAVPHIWISTTAADTTDNDAAATIPSHPPPSSSSSHLFISPPLLQLVINTYTMCIHQIQYAIRLRIIPRTSTLHSFPDKILYFFWGEGADCRVDRAARLSVVVESAFLFLLYYDVSVMLYCW